MTNIDTTTATITATTTETTTATWEDVKGLLSVKGSYSGNRNFKFPEGIMYSTTSRISSEVTLKRLIAETDRTVVYEATFDGKDVVMKFGFDQERRDALKREAQIYRRKLRDLQGTVIPIFYGYYFGRMREKVYEYQERDMACIVLENCGNRLPSFDCLSYDQRLEIFDLMVKLHRHGYHQYDFAYRNVCLKDGKFRLIDLEHVKRHHIGYKAARCRWEGDRRQLHIGGDYPTDILRCRDLIEIGSEMDLWFPSNEYNLRGPETSDTDQLPSRIIVDKLLPIGYRLDRNRLKATVAWLKDVKKELDMCSDEESTEELIKRRSEEFPKSWLYRVLP